jgi:hypothetical protein
MEREYFEYNYGDTTYPLDCCIFRHIEWTHDIGGFVISFKPQEEIVWT